MLFGVVWRAYRTGSAGGAGGAYYGYKDDDKTLTKDLTVAGASLVGGGLVGGAGAVGIVGTAVAVEKTKEAAKVATKAAKIGGEVVGVVETAKTAKGWFSSDDDNKKKKDRY